MPKIFYGNFEFEHELESTGYRPPARIQEMSAQLATHLIALSQDGDAVWSPLEIPESFLDAVARAGLAKVRCIGLSDHVGTESVEKLVFAPWGFSPDSNQFAQSRNWGADSPEVVVVRQVNDRAFGFELEREFECGLPGIARVSSRDDLLEAIRNASAIFQTPESRLRWVVKSRFGMASRERILGTGTQLDDPSAGWLWKQFQKNGLALFEPWMACEDELGVREFSTQWVIPQSDKLPVLLGWTEIQTERSGTPSAWFRPVCVPFADCEFRSALPILKAAVDRVAAAGYFGPIGIDSMRFPLPGQDSEPAARGETAMTIRPLQDINARYTMGRVALELAERLAPDRDAAWLQLPTKWLCRVLNVSSAEDASKLYSERGVDISEPLLEAAREAGSELPCDTRAWLTSPLWTEDVLANRCGILIASREESKLAEFFRGLNVLHGGNITRQEGRRT